MRWIGMIAIGMLMACGKPTAPQASDEEAAQRTESASAPSSAPAAPTPASLYAACRDRVEQPETEGECKADGDCAAAGCSQEICTTAAAAKDVTSTCEVRECFQVLDHCGCVQGKCTWSLKDTVPVRTPHALQ